MSKIKKSLCNNWSNDLFVKNAELYLPILQSMKKEALLEVEWLTILFDEMGIKKGAKILDFSCGIGRHAIPLAKKGYEVVGYDPSPLFIKEAKRCTNAEIKDPKKIKFYNGPPVHASEILLKYKEKYFDCVIIMFTSLGYSSLQDDILLLNDITKVSKPGSLLITDTENRDWRISNFQPYMSYFFDDLEIHETWKIELEKSIAEGIAKFYRVNKAKNVLKLLRQLNLKLRLYSLHELIFMIEAAGWTHYNSYGSFDDLEPPSSESKRLITVNRRKL